MKRPATSPLAPSSTGNDTSLLSKALRDLSGASNLKDERVGHYLATWALSCPLARRQFNNAVQYVNTATSTAHWRRRSSQNVRKPRKDKGKGWAREHILPEIVGYVDNLGEVLDSCSSLSSFRSISMDASSSSGITASDEESGTDSDSDSE